MNELRDSRKSDHQVLGGADGWKKMGRRWCVVLAAMLVGNLFLIVLAVAGYGKSESPAELSDLAIAKRAAIAAKTSAAAAVHQANKAETNNGESTHQAINPSDLMEEVVLESDRIEPKVVQVPIDQPPASGSDAETSDTEKSTAIAASAAQTQPQEEDNKPTTTPDPSITDDDDWQQPLPTIARSDDSSLVIINSGLVIINPPATGGIVHYVVDGEVCSLLPAKYHCFAVDTQKKVVFHKGDDFSDATETMEEGVFVFVVTEDGWELKPADLAASQRLLNICRMAEKIASDPTLDAAAGDP